MTVKLYTLNLFFIFPQVRLSALQALKEMHKKLGEDYLNLLPETMPFISELMEGKCAPAGFTLSSNDAASCGVTVQTQRGRGGMRLFNSVVKFMLIA